MTMHLVKPYLSTTRYNIRKPKLSPKDIKAKKEHEKFLRQMGVCKSVGTESVAETPTYSRPVDDVKLSNKITGGGYKRSGYGRDGGVDGIYSHGQTKRISKRLY